MIKNSLIGLLFCVISFATSQGFAQAETEHAKKSLEIYEKLISIPTVAGRGQVPKMASYLESQFLAAGFKEDEINIVPNGEAVSMTVIYKGSGSVKKRPILLLGHMDVVEALEKDWDRPPFVLSRDETFFYGRGTVDNKYGITMLASTFIRMKKAGFTPNRDLILVFSGDEETSMATTIELATRRPELADAEFALNSDAGGGSLTADGKPVAYLVQAAEKTYATFEITSRNAGGHSSRPRADNAIYELANALTKIQKHRFSVRSSKMTRDFFRISGEQRGGTLGAAMVRFADNPNDKEASDMLANEPSYVGSTRTTCVATMLNAGHAENALPQSATATINCRIFPGVSVAKVEAELRKVVGNDALEFKVLDSPVESPISELRDDVMQAVKSAVTPQEYPLGQFPARL